MHTYTSYSSGKPGDVRYCRDEVAAVTAWFALHPPANKNIK